MKSFLAFVCMLLPGIVLGKDYFTAAVFEHRPRYDNDSLEVPMNILSANLKIYEKAIHLAAERGADILVFNEYGLSQHVPNRNRLREFAENIPDPRKGKYNPCIDKEYNTFLLSTFSCHARKHKMYIVVNFQDIKKCSDTCDADRVDGCEECMNDGVFLYNADVVFDREGNLVAKYYKTQIFFEHVNAPKKLDFVTFKTDFGTFGLQTCFDGAWEGAVLLAKDHGIDTLLYPAFWYDDIFPFNAIEYHQGWALANGVNLVAANIHKPGSGSLGSGIHSKDSGALVYTYDPDGESKLLMANIGIGGNKNVPPLSTVTVVTEKGIIEKKEDGSNFPEHCHYKKAGLYEDMYADYRCYKSHIEKHNRVKLESPSGEVESCHKGFCCHLKYSADSLKEDFYLTAFSGANEVRNYFHLHEETCMLIRCDPLGDKECVLHSSRSSTVFKEVELKAKFESFRVYGTVSLDKFRLAPKEQWDQSTVGSETKITFKSDSNEPLVKVGLFGRNFAKDAPYKVYRHTQYYD